VVLLALEEARMFNHNYIGIEGPGCRGFA